MKRTTYSDSYTGLIKPRGPRVEATKRQTLVLLTTAWDMNITADSKKLI